MRPLGIILIVLSPLILLTGCPFEAKVPLRKPTTGSIDSRLVGAWSGTDVKGGDSLEVLILPFNDAEYYIEVVENDESRNRYRAYAIAVAGEQLLQVGELTADGAADGFVLARYTLADDHELQVRFVGDKIVPKNLESDPAGLLEFLSSHLGDPALDDQDVRLALRPETGDD
jgi:hypothetical protein